MAIDKILNLIFRIKGAKKAEQEVSKVDSKLVALGKNAVKVGAAFFAAKGVVTAFQSLSASSLASQQVTDLTNAMVNLGGEAGFTAESLEKFKEATDNTVSSAQLLQNTNTALVLGVAQTDDQMADLFDTAQRLGKALGVDTQFAVESLTTGLGRQSKLILDNLGITVDSTQAYKDYAKEIGVTVKNLTEQQKKTAFVNTAMRKAKEAVELLGPEQLTLKETNEQLTVALNDLGLAIGKATLPAVNFFTKGITAAIRAVTALTNATQNNRREQHEEILSYKGLSEEIDDSIERYEKLVSSTGIATARTKNQGKTVLELVDGFQKLKQIQNNMIAESAMEIITEDVEELTKAELEAIENFDVMNNVIDAGVEHFKKFGEQLTDNQQLAIIGVERFGSALATAAIHGQNMGDAITSSLKSIAAELVSKAATFAMLNLFTGGSLMAAQGGAGFGGFLLRGFTGQTPSVNVNIQGGLVSQSYVKNTLVPALNNARAIG